MITIAHISDVHFRPIKRHKEYKKAFTRLFYHLKSIKPDIVINTGDFYHLKTAQLTPEVIELMSWAFDELSKIAPTYSILGNHDYVISNQNRKNIISIIHKILDKNKVILLEKSKTEFLNIKNKNIALHPFSLYDKDNWSNLKPINDYINIALFHGSVVGCVTDTNWKIRGCEESVEFFKKFDFTLLGDIHKRQWLSEKIDKFGNSKPWIAYPGSLIQQNFGEDENKGFLVWKINDKNDWEVEFKELENYSPFITTKWMGNIHDTVSNILQNREELLPGTRFRIISSQEISLLETRKLLHELKNTYKASDVIFKCNSISRMDHFVSNNTKIFKKSLRQDPEAVLSLYENYVSEHIENYNFDKEKIDEAKNIIKNYMVSFLTGENEDVASNINWSVKSFEFDNLFRYGENNKIDFERLNGTVGIFGPNKTGKALDVNTLIPTIDGWKEIRDITTNDFVFDRKGKSCRVLAKSNIFYNHKCYRITFSDNTEVVADAEHQWIVNDHRGICPVEKTITTEELYSGNVKFSTDKYRWSITNCNPVEYDGKLSKEDISNFITNTKKICIPEKILLSSVNDRFNFLKNVLSQHNVILDRCGGVELSHVNKNFINSMFELISSLGFSPKISIADNKIDFKLNFFISKNMDKVLTEKYQDFIRNPDYNRRYITNIVVTKSVPVQCLVVDSPDHSFLFSKGYIPTHNSSIIGAMMYTLFNTTDRGPVKNNHIINYNKKFGKGKIIINVEGNDYIIERESKKIPNRKGKKDDKTSNVVNFYKVEYENGVEKHKICNSISRDETDKLIRKLIGTANDFLLTALSSQGNIDKFIKEGPTERKNILSRFLDLDLFKQLSEVVRKDLNTLNAKSSGFSVENINNTIKITKKEIVDLEKIIEEIDKKITLQDSQKEKIKLWLMHHEKSAAEIDIEKISNIEDFLLKNKKSLSEKEKSTIILEKELIAFKQKLKEVLEIKEKINIKLLKSKINDFEIIKSKLNELKHEISSQENKLSLQKKNIKKLDLVPCGNKFPNCHYIKDGHEDKKLVKSQEELIKVLNEKFSSQQETFNNFLQEKLQENIQLWEEKNKEELSLTNKINNKENQLLYENKELTHLKTSIKTQEVELNSYKKKVNILEGKEFQIKKLNLEKIIKNINELNKIKHEKLVLFGSKKEKLQNLLHNQKESSLLIDKLKILNSIQDAFSKTGIPAMVLMSQLPSINSELDKILGSVVDFKITLETDISSNIMDVYIEDGHSRRIIELASGMEKTIASMALRVALINLSSLPKPDIFIIDEGYGALDSENMQSAILFLQSLKNYFKTILTVSHIPEIKDSADIILDIENNGLDSKINYPN